MKGAILLLFTLCLFSKFLSQTTFSFSGYTSGQTYTSNSYTYTNTPVAGCVTMSARVTQTASPGWFNLTGGMSPNYNSSGYSCSTAGLYLVTDRSTTSPVVSLELSFSSPVCGPVTFTITDINGANVSLPTYGGFRDDITITAYDQNNSVITLSTAMVTNNGSGSCGGGSFGPSYVVMSGSSLKIVGCTYDDCYTDYFTIYSATKMISKIVIDYASGSKDWGGTTISNPDRQYVIVNNVRAYTPCFNMSYVCGNPVSLTATQLSGFPPTSGTGLLAGYPNPGIATPTAPTYLWTGTAGTFSVTSPSSLASTTNVSGLGSGGGTFTMTGQNNKGCSATKQLTINSTNCVVLPIELLSFEGLCFDKERRFYWSTSSEHNNDYFVLQQSRDGEHFFDVQRIKGAGNSEELKTYMAISGLSGGDYFRIMQVDINGEYTFSDLTYVPCKINSVEELSIFPNPVESSMSIDFSGFNESELSVRIVDLNGRTVFNSLRPLNDDSSIFTIDVNEIDQGIYSVLVIDNSNQEILFTKRIVKL